MANAVLKGEATLNEYRDKAEKLKEMMHASSIAKFDQIEYDRQMRIALEFASDEVFFGGPFSAPPKD